MPIGNLHASKFKIDEYSENWTLFKKTKSLDLIGRIGLEEKV